MALGGFLGSDPILSVDQLQARVDSGQVRFFLLGGGFGGARGGCALSGWVQSTCAEVPAQPQLYDCAASVPT